MASRPEHVTEKDLATSLQPVILGADYSAYAYVRAFREAYGARSIIYGSSDVKSISRTRFAEYRVVEGFDEPEVLLSTLAALGEELCAAGRVPFLVTCGDFYARIVSQHKSELERWFYTPVVDFDVLDFVTQKENFYRVCEEVGVPYPKTRFLDCSDPSARADDAGFTYPLVAKPSNSAAYHYAEFPGKKKIFIVETPDELRRIFDDLKRSCYDESLIIQEFVPGGDSHMYAIYLYADANSNVVFSVCGHVGLEDHHPGAIGNAVAIVPEPNAEVEAAAARFVKRVGYHGMGTFDAKWDARTGEFKFLEMNARPGRSSWFVLLAGINFARIQVEDVVLGRAPAPVTPRDDWAYVAVPRKVIERCMPAGPLRDRILASYRNKTASFALDWRGGHDALEQRLWAYINYFHQVQKFEKYLPDGDAS